MVGQFSHSSLEAFPDKIVATEDMEDGCGVLELSCSFLEVHCRVFGLRDFMALVSKIVMKIEGGIFRGSLWPTMSHSCPQLQLLG